MGNDYLKGRGAQYNPDNRFAQYSLDKTARDGIDDYAVNKPKTEVFVEHPKKAVSRNQSPDLKMMYSVNPYQGCEHGCVYCYARNSHQYWGFGAGTDFESKLVVKPNIAALLKKELGSKNWKPEPLMLSGNTDCYQPLERRYKLTRSILKIALDYRHPVSIVTKNTLIKRDLDVLQELAGLQLVHVNFSISTLDERLRNKLEPRTASVKSKLETMDLLSKNGIPVGIMNAPIIPGLTHQEIPEILRNSANAGAQGAAYTILRLNGVVGEITRDWLEKNFPDRTDKIWNQVRDIHGGKVSDSTWGRRLTGTGNYARIIQDLFTVSYKKYFSDRSMPPLNTGRFRRSGHYRLFE